MLGGSARRRTAARAYISGRSGTCLLPDGNAAARLDGSYGRQRAQHRRWGVTLAQAAQGGVKGAASPTWAWPPAAMQTTASNGSSPPLATRKSIPGGTATASPAVAAIGSPPAGRTPTVPRSTTNPPSLVSRGPGAAAPGRPGIPPAPAPAPPRPGAPRATLPK